MYLKSLTYNHTTNTTKILENKDDYTGLPNQTMHSEVKMLTTYHHYTIFHLI